jgi:hypothetical protein
MREGGFNFQEGNCGVYANQAVMVMTHPHLVAESSPSRLQLNSMVRHKRYYYALIQSENNTETGHYRIYFCFKTLSILGV